MQKTLWIAALAVLLSAAPARAGDADGRYVALGPGAASCREVPTTETSSTRYFMLLGWVGGYLTATHYQVDATYSLAMDAGEATDWIMAYCRRNPLALVSTAAETLLWILYPQRIQAAPAVSLPPTPTVRPVVPALPQWEQPPPTPKPSIPAKSRKRS